MSFVRPIARSRSPHRRLLIQAFALILLTAAAFLLLAWYELHEATKPPRAGETLNPYITAAHLVAARADAAAEQAAALELVAAESAALSDSAALNGTAAVGGKPAAAQTVRVDVNRLERLLNLAGELIIDLTRLQEVDKRVRVSCSDGGAATMLTDVTAHFGRVIGDLQDGIMKTRMLPIDQGRHAIGCFAGLEE